MLRVHRIFLMLVLVLTAVPVVRLLAWKSVGEIVPVMERVTPAEVRPGGIVTVTGFQLDSKHVSELYLSGNEVRYQVEIFTQNDREIRFRVPEYVPLGDVCIAMKLVGQIELVEQPVFLKIIQPAG